MFPFSLGFVQKGDKMISLPSVKFSSKRRVCLKPPHQFTWRNSKYHITAMNKGLATSEWSFCGHLLPLPATEFEIKQLWINFLKNSYTVITTNTAPHLPRISLWGQFVQSQILDLCIMAYSIIFNLASKERLLQRIKYCNSEVLQRTIMKYIYEVWMNYARSWNCPDKNDFQKYLSRNTRLHAIQ